MSSSRTISIPILFLASCFVVTWIDGAGSLPYDNFERDYFEKEQYLITTTLEPCGCILQDVMPSLSTTTQKDFADYQTLYEAEGLLYGQLSKQLKTCACTDALETIEQTTLPSNPPGTSPTTVITNEIADRMIQRVTGILNMSLDTCCVAAKSTRNYYFIDGEYSFFEAAEDAKKRGGNLATILSRHDSMKAYSVIAGKKSPVGADGTNAMFAWIGLLKKLDVWQWNVDTQPQVGYTNWGYLEPSSGEPNPCAAIALSRWSGATSGATGQWDSMTCATKLPYLLETTTPQNTGGDKNNLKEITIIIAVLLGLFLLASLAIIAKKVIGPTCGGQNRAPRRTLRRANGAGRRRRAHNPQEGEAENEMTAVDASVTEANAAQHLPRNHRSSGGHRRRVHFPQGGSRPEAGGRESAYSPRGDERFSSERSSSGEAVSGAVRRQRNALLNDAVRREVAARTLATQNATGAPSSSSIAERRTQMQAQKRRPEAPPAPGDEGIGREETRPSAQEDVLETHNAATPDSMSFERHFSMMSNVSNNSNPSLQAIEVQNPEAQGAVSGTTPLSSTSFLAQQPEDPLSFLDALPPASPEAARRADIPT